ncbi:MAG: hypothetical protein IPJ27_20615 [Candidatus Accumulibacter sp.]|jgi:hypothetical protein|uniref:Uncharacterized protein n=1 Tax=Candidatus Accumulibacter proximus TaxID=2954385 RepID=A0A935Q0V1_9PROT|nr:hypothetical protein [Candidatus Accumulibacter proximus]
MTTLQQKRLAKLEESQRRRDVCWDLDRLFAQAGTSRAAILAEHGTLWAFRDWLDAQAEEVGQTGRTSNDHGT